MSQVPEFLLYLLIYFVIFSAIGMLFYGADRWVKRRLRRPVRCASCGAEFDASLLHKGFGKCPSCGRRQPGANRVS